MPARFHRQPAPLPLLPLCARVPRHLHTSEGVVERVSFRGDSLELLVNVNDNQIIAKRGLEEKSIAVGEKVDVFIYRLFVTVGEKAMLLENQSLVDDSVFI